MDEPLSYDYTILRICRPVECLNDLAHDIVVEGDWRDEAYRVLSAALPAVHWKTTADGLRCDGTSLGMGRFELSAVFDGVYTIVLVRGSHHVDQSRFIAQLAEMLQAAAFDSQTGRAL